MRSRELVTLSAAAVRLGISRATLRAWAQNRKSQFVPFPPAIGCYRGNFLWEFDIIAGWCDLHAGYPRLGSARPTTRGDAHWTRRHPERVKLPGLKKAG